MARNLKITIVTVSYNVVQTIEQTIKSVILQSYDNIEYIVIDGGSCDGTEDVIKCYKDQIAYWVSEPDAGIYDAMNKGVKIATGDYIQFLGADDSLFSVHTIADVVNAMVDGIDVLSAGIMVVHEKSLLEKYMGNQGVRDHQKYDGSMAPHPGMFVKRELLLRYMFDNSYKVAADYDFFLKCYLDSGVQFQYIDQPVVYFSLDGVSSNSSDTITEHIDIMKKYKLDEDIIRRIDKTRPSLFRRLVKYIIKFMHMRRCSLRLRGWKRHKCHNYYCRWCNRTI